MQFSAADIAAFTGAMGETCTLQNRAYKRIFNAIYSQELNPGSPLDGISAQEQYSLVCASSDTTGITTDWQAIVRGIIRPVLALIPDGSGFTKIVLGDPMGGSR